MVRLWRDKRIDVGLKPVRLVDRLVPTGRGAKARFGAVIGGAESSAMALARVSQRGRVVSALSPSHSKRIDNTFAL